MTLSFLESFFQQFSQSFLHAIAQFDWTSILDILIVAYVFYRVLMLIKGTRAVQLIKGLVVLLLASYLSELLGLSTIRWILTQAWAVIFVALAVIFQPELRRALEQLGRGKVFFSSPKNELGAGDAMKVIDELIGCAIFCAKTKTGALIVLEQETGLNDYIETGIRINAEVSEELLTNIFVPNTPLHDGASIIRGNQIMAAACFLPLSDNPYLSTALGTRHRAAIGVSEVSDAVVIVVSEESGVISVAKEGKLLRYLDEKQLRETLSGVFAPKEPRAKRFWHRRAKK